MEENKPVLDPEKTDVVNETGDLTNAPAEVDVTTAPVQPEATA